MLPEGKKLLVKPTKDFLSFTALAQFATIDNWGDSLLSDLLSGVLCQLQQYVQTPTKSGIDFKSRRVMLLGGSHQHLEAKQLSQHCHCVPLCPLLGALHAASLRGHNNRRTAGVWVRMEGV